jgi:hypothetical protein
MGSEKHPSDQHRFAPPRRRIHLLRFERHPQEYEIMRAISPDTVYSAIESALAAERASVPLCHPA